MFSPIQIMTQPALLEINWGKAELSIRQPRGELQIETSRAKMDITQPRPELQIDQHEAWRAYNGGTALEMNHQIYSQLPDLFLEGLAKRVEQGNRMANFHLPGNSIGEIYGTDWKRDTFVEFRSPASYDNVNINVIPNRPEIEITPFKPDIQGMQRNPEIDFSPGYVDISVKQYASIKITPPRIDITM